MDTCPDCESPLRAMKNKSYRCKGCGFSETYEEHAARKANRVQFARASLEQLRGHLKEMTFDIGPAGEPRERNLADHMLMFHLDAIENQIASWEEWQRKFGR